MLYKYLGKPFYIEDTKIVDTNDILDIYKEGTNTYTIKNNNITCYNIKIPTYIKIIEKCKMIND